MASNITFRNAASANANNVAITTPAKGDLILVFSFNNASTTIPTLAAGYTSIASNSTTATAGLAAYKISDGTETTSGTWTNATNVVAMIYRGAFQVGASASGVGNSATITYPALTLQISDGSSWVAAGAIEKAATAGMNGTTTALISNRTNQTTVNGLDTNGGVASYIAQTLTVTTSGRFVAFSVELRQAPAPAETLSLSDGDTVQIRGGSVDFQNLGNNSQTANTGTVGSETLAFKDGNLDFVLAPSVIAKSDQMPWGAPQSGNWAGFETFEFALRGGSAGELLVKADQITTLTDEGSLTLGTPLPFTGSIVCQEEIRTWADEIVIALVPQQIQVVITDTIANEYFTRFPLTETPLSEGGRWLGGATVGLDWQDFQSLNGLASTAAIAANFTDATAILTGTWGPDQRVEGLVHSINQLASLNQELEIRLRSKIAPHFCTGYEVDFQLKVDGTQAGSISRWDGVLGDFVQLGRVDTVGTPTYPGVKDGDTIAGEIIGNVIKLSINGTVWLTVTDNKYTDGNPGIGGQQTSVQSGHPLTDFGFVQILVSTSGQVDSMGSNFQQLKLFDRIPLGYETVPPNAAPKDYIFYRTQSVAFLGDGGQANWQDSFSFVLTGGALTEVLSDTMTMSDALAIGYGNALVEQLVFSDASGIGYGDLIADSMTMSDSVVIVLGENINISESLTISDTMGLGYGLRIGETLTMSDSVILGFGEGITETLTISDQLGLGYGFIISDTMTMSDSVVIVLGETETIAESLTISDSLALGYGLLIADTLTMSDSVILGFGEGIFETLTISDQLNLGYGFLISDTMTMSDSFALQLSIALVVSDTMSMSDTVFIGYGDLIFETMSMSDSVVIGYGEGIFETLTISDQLGLGYGLLIADIMTMSDSVVVQLSIAINISETLTISDSMSLGYGLLIAESLTLSDAVTLLLGELMNIAESLTISDTMGLGYGLIIGDSMTMSDAFAFNLVTSGLFEQLSDTMTMSDSEAIGYGNQLVEQLIFQDSMVVGYGLQIADVLAFSDQLGVGYGNVTQDQMNMQDATAFIEGMLIQIAEATPAQLDALSMLFTFGLQIGESITFQDQLRTMYGLIIGDSMTLADNLNPQLLSLLNLALADSGFANWLDAILLTMSFAPGKMVIHSLAVLQEVVSGLQTIGKISMHTLPTEFELTAGGSVVPKATIHSVKVETEV